MLLEIIRIGFHLGFFFKCLWYNYRFFYFNSKFIFQVYTSIMGQALQRAAQWTSAKGGSGGKLEFTKLNEELLNSIIQYVDGFSAKYADESKLVFKKPLTWQTTVSPDAINAPGLEDRCVFLWFHGISSFCLFSKKKKINAVMIH